MNLIQKEMLLKAARLGCTGRGGGRRGNDTEDEKTVSADKAGACVALPSRAADTQMERQPAAAVQ